MGFVGYTTLIGPITCFFPRTLFLLPSDLAPSRPLMKLFGIVFQIEGLGILLEALPARKISPNHHFSELLVRGTNVWQHNIYSLYQYIVIRP